jgi:hypothetical protein
VEYDGVRAVEDACDLIGRHLPAFLAANAAFMVLQAVTTVGLSYGLWAVGGATAGHSTALAVLASYALVVPVWSAANVLAAQRSRTRTIGYRDFWIDIRGPVIMSTISSYWLARLAAAMAILLLVVPGVLVYCRLMLSVPASVSVESWSPIRPLERSWEMTRGRFVDLYALAAAVGVATPTSLAPLVISLSLWPPGQQGDLIQWYQFARTLLGTIPAALLLALYVPLRAVALFNMFSALDHAGCGKT